MPNFENVKNAIVRRKYLAASMFSLLVVGVAIVFFNSKDISDSSQPTPSSTQSPAPAPVSSQSSVAEKRTAVYPPQITLGNLAIKEPIYFFWNTSQGSAEVFRRYIYPLVKLGDRAPIKVRMLHMLTDAKYGVTPGSLFYCAPDRETYNRMVITYLLYGRKLNELFIVPEDPKRKIYINKGMQGALGITGQTLSGCIAKENMDAFMERSGFAMGMNYNYLDEFGSKIDIARLPVIVIKDQLIMGVDRPKLERFFRQYAAPQQKPEP